MDAIERIFKNRKIQFDKLPAFGFTDSGDYYSLERTLKGSDFILTVNISKDGTITTKTVDPALDEVYTLHLAEGATGAFIGEIRQAYEDILLEISQNCTTSHIFKNSQTLDAISHIKTAHGDELEFLWPKFPTDAICRRKDNQKWYGVFMTVSARKLGIDSDQTLEVLDLRMSPEEKDELIDGNKYMLGYHMNKNSWLTIVLDGRVANKDLFERIDKSYALALKK